MLQQVQIAYIIQFLVQMPQPSFIFITVDIQYL